jgi:hypothetical protein
LSEETESEAGSPTQRLPFIVRIVRDERQLLEAVRIRQAAYERHVPVLAADLRDPEPDDREEGTAVLLAESRLDGQALGSLRIQTNRRSPIPIERSVALPISLSGRRLAEGVRLGVCQGSMGRVVKTMLFKAFYQYCRYAGVEWMVIGARAPLDRQYESLLFADVFPGVGFVPLAHAGNLPHRILSFEMRTAVARWREAGHPLYRLFCHIRHPDILVRDEQTRIRTRRPRDPVVPVHERRAFRLAVVRRDTPGMDK